MPGLSRFSYEEIKRMKKTEIQRRKKLVISRKLLMETDQANKVIDSVRHVAYEHV